MNAYGCTICGGSDHNRSHCRRLTFTCLIGRAA